MYETLIIVNTIVVIIAGILGVLATLCTPFRNLITGRKKEKEHQLDEEKKRDRESEERRETDRCLLRNRIREIYYKNKDTKTLRQYEYEDLEHMVAQYKKLNGNSFVEKIWEEIQNEWDIVE